MMAGKDGFYVREALPRADFGMNAQGRLDFYGFEGVRDGDLLMLSLGLPEGKTREILDRWSLPDLFHLDFSDLKRILGPARAMKFLSAFELARRMLQKGIGILPVISGPSDTVPFLAGIKDEKKEYFLCLYLNARNQVIRREVISIGSLSASIVHPREVLLPALLHSSASIILAHNHPSQNVEPSKDDLELTRRLIKAGEIMGLEVLDHIIIGSTDFLSLKEKGLM